jgi:magnesium transporter
MTGSPDPGVDNHRVIRSFSWPHGSAAPIREPDGLAPEPSPGGWVWVDLAGESPATINRVCHQFEIDEFFVDEALSVGSLPMIETQRDLVYLVLNAFSTGPAGRLVSTELDVFLGPGYLVTAHAGDIEATTLLMERLEHGVELASPTPAGLLAHLAMVGSRRFPPLIEHLETQLDELEDLATTADPRAIVAVQALRRDVIVLRRVLAPQREIYFELAESAHALIDEPSRKMFERVADYQAQLLDSLDTARSLLGSVLETHRGAVADQTNEIVRVLTVFSAIMLPLGLVTGVFGRGRPLALLRSPRLRRGPPAQRPAQGGGARPLPGGHGPDPGGGGGDRVDDTPGHRGARGTRRARQLR